jgi:hypothetical protein
VYCGAGFPYVTFSILTVTYAAQVLQLIHHRVIDTAALYPHPSGLPYKHALRRLAKEYLHKDVQDGKGERLAVLKALLSGACSSSKRAMQCTRPLQRMPNAVCVWLTVLLCVYANNVQRGTTACRTPQWLWS